MPRVVNPGLIANGGGLAAQRSVEASAFVHPTQGLDGLIAHIIDPSRAHEARAINLIDVGGFYASDNVEGALQEIGGGLAAAGQNGVIEGCTFTAGGLTIQLATPSTVRIGTSMDFSGATISLTNNQTCWVYVDTTGTLVHSTGATPPSPFVPENVLLWKIITSGGSITGSTDARFFVPNIDRKMFFTVRSEGTDPNRNSEACFESLDAAWLYLTEFNTAQRKKKLIIRGQHTLTKLYGFPFNDIVLEGEDGAEFIAGAATGYMFDINGKDRIQFRDILFTCNTALMYCLAMGTSGSNDILIERCRFLDGTSTWVRPIDFSFVHGPVTIRDSSFRGSEYGIYLNNSTQARVIDCTVEDGSFGTALAGIVVGDISTGAGPSEVLRCEVGGFFTSVQVRGADQTVRGCRLLNAITGIQTIGSGTTPRLQVLENYIQLSAGVGLTGISVTSNSDDIQIRGNTIENPRGAGTYLIGDVPKGINLGATLCDRPFIADNTITGFFNSVGNLGRCIDIATATSATVHDCNLVTAFEGIFAGSGATDMKVRGCRISGVTTGINLQCNRPSISDTTIFTSATTGLIGINLFGANDAKVNGSTIRSLRTGYGVGDVPYGINATVASGLQVVDCVIRDFRNDTTPSLGTGIAVINTASDNPTIMGGHIDNSAVGISFDTGVSASRVTNIRLSDVDTGIISNSPNAIFTGVQIDLSSSSGIIGIDVFGDSTLISNTRIRNPRPAGSYGGGDNPYGIQINGVDKVSIVNVDIDGFYNSVGNLGYCIVASGTTDNISIEGGILDAALEGISINAGAGFRIAATAIQNVQTGIRVGGTRNTISGCNINVSSTRGLEGIVIEGADTVVTGTQILCPRAVFGAPDAPTGVSINAAYAKVSNCLIRGWRNTTGSLGMGATCFTGAGNVTFSANTVETCWHGFHAITAAAANNIIVADNEFRNLDGDGILADKSNNVKITGNTLDNAGTFNAIYVANGTDIEILGNKIDGNGVTDAGISLAGANTAANRMRRVVVSNNNIRAFTGRGISITDYVQNVVVSGNQIDGFIASSPTDYSPISCIVVEALSAGNVPKHLEFTGNTLWRAKNGIMLTGLDISDPITNIKVEGNNIHHCAVSSGGALTCVAVDAFWVEALSILGNDINKMGLVINNSDVESTPAAGANVYPIGVRLRNCSRLNVSNNSITDTTRAGGGLSSGITLSNRDTVSTYNALSLVINGNQITQQGGVIELSIGIIVTSGQVTSGTGASSTLRGLNIAGNTIRRLIYEGIVVFAGGGSAVEQVNIVGNTIIQTSDASFGFGIWVGTSASLAFGGGVLREVNIANNNTGLTAATGIYVSGDEDCALTVLSITDNTVADAGLRCIDIESTSPPPLEFTDFTITGNTCTLATPISATDIIRVNAIDIDLENVNVSNNVITGPNGAPFSSIAATGSITTVTKAALANNETFTISDGSRSITFAFEKTGAYVPVTGEITVDIQLDTTANDVRDTMITAINGVAGFGVTASNGGAGLVSLVNDQGGDEGNNTISDTVANAGFTHTGMSGGFTTSAIEVSATTSAATDVLLNAVQINENKILGDGSGIFINAEGIATGMVVLGNQVTLNVPGIQRGLRIRNQPDAAIAVKYSGNWNIADNHFHGGHGVYIDINNGPALFNVSFTNNHVTKSNDTGFRLELINVGASFFGLVASLANLTLSGNTFESGAAQGSLEAIRLILGTATVGGGQDFASSVVVSNNRCLYWNNFAGNASRAIWVRTNCPVAGLKVIDNSLFGNGNTGSVASEGIIDVELGQDAGKVATRNVDISRNNLETNFGGYGIYVHRHSGTDESCLRQLRVCDNQILGVSGFSPDGIRVTTEVFVADGVGVFPGDFAIDGNSISRIAAAASISDVGIYFSGPTGTTLENLSFSRNQLSATGGGDGTDSLGAISVLINNVAQNVRMDGNTIHNPLNGGIYCYSNNNSLNFSMCDNQVYNAVTTTGTTTNGTLQMRLGGAASGMENISFKNNALEACSERGIVFNSAGSPVVRNVQITGNAFRSQQFSAIFVNLSPFTTSVDNVDVSHNTISNQGGTDASTVDRCGVFVKTPTGVTLRNLSVCDNLMKDWSNTTLPLSSEADAIQIYMQDNVEGLTVSRNMIRNCPNDGIGLWFNSDFVANVVINDNSINMSDSGRCGVAVLLGDSSTVNFIMNGNTIFGRSTLLNFGMQLTSSSTVGNFYGRGFVFSDNIIRGCISLGTPTDIPNTTLLGTATSWNTAADSKGLSVNDNISASAVGTAGTDHGWTAFAFNYAGTKTSNHNQDNIIA